MKVTVTADGEVSFDTDDVAQAVDMVKRLRNTNGHHEKREKRKYTKKEDVEPLPPGRQPSKVLVDTWNYLVSTDASSGVTADEVAAGMSILPSTAAYRLNRLVALNMAHHVKRGWFRPGERSTESP